MGSEYRWHIENRIIYAFLFDNITQDDLRKGNEAITQFIEANGIPPVHIIFDTTSVDRIMTTVVQVRSELHYFQDNRIGWCVVFGLHGLVDAAVRFTSGIIGRATGINIQIVPTLNDALSFLNQVDPTLNTESQ
jgi:hypothetical protein